MLFSVLLLLKYQLLEDRGAVIVLFTTILPGPRTVPDHSIIICLMNE